MSPPTYFTWQELSPYRSSARAARPLVLQFADDHHAFHEDAKPGDLTGQCGTRSFNSSKKFWTITSSLDSVSSKFRIMTKR